MTPMTPNVIASPIAISTSTDPRLRPKNSVSIAGIETFASDRWSSRQPLPHCSNLLVGFDEFAVGRFLQQTCQLVPDILTEAARESRDGLESRLRHP